MYLIFPVIVIVIVTVIVLLQCLACSFGQNQKANIADMHYDYDYDYDYDNAKKQDTKSVLETFYNQLQWLSAEICKDIELLQL